MKKINTYRLTKEEILKAIADYMEMYHPDIPYYRNSHNQQRRLLRLSNIRGGLLNENRNHIKQVRNGQTTP